MVCVKGHNTENDKSLHTNYLSFSVLHIIWFVWRHGLCDLYPSLHTNHLQFSVIQIIWFVVTIHISWFVWRDGLCHFTETRHNPSLHTNHPFTQTILPHKLLIISLHTNLIICNTEYDKWIMSGLWERIKSLHKDQMQSIPSHNPSLHTNHPFTQTIPSHKPSLHTIHPFTQSILFTQTW